MEDKLYKVQDIANELGVLPQLIYSRIDKRDVSPVVIKGVMHFTKEDAKKLMEYHKRGRKTGV